MRSPFSEKKKKKSDEMAASKAALISLMSARKLAREKILFKLADGVFEELRIKE